jgi:signal transduction histidine kinase
MPTEEEFRQLEERLQRRERQIEAVLRITSALHARTELDELSQQTLLASVKTVGASGGTLYLHEPKEAQLVFKYVIGPAADVLMGRKMPDSQGVVGHVFQTGESQITHDASRDQRHLRAIDEQTKVQTENMVTVPLKTTQGQVIGVMQVLNKQTGQFDRDDLEVLEILSSLAASAIDTARLYEDARLAEVVHRIGDISHDIKNMVTPAQTGTQTLEMLMSSMFDDIDAILEAPATPAELAASLRDSMSFVRSFYPEAVEMTLAGTEATQERVREIADAIKGIVSEPQFEPANVNDVAELVARTLRHVADRAGVLLDLTGLNGVPPADIDKKRIYNALYNLVGNAIPETPRGGTVAIRTALVTDDAGEERLQIDVADTGRGIPEEVRALLFTEQAKSTKVGGTGLGTKIVKNVVDAHGGTIVVESQQGVGTTFRIRVPMRQPAK